MPVSVSPQAAAHLRAMIADTDIKDPVVTIGKSASTAGEDMGWYVGLIEGANLWGLRVEPVAGMNLFIDELWRNELECSTLELQAGRLVIVTKPGGA